MIIFLGKIVKKLNECHEEFMLDGRIKFSDKQLIH